MDDHALLEQFRAEMAIHGARRTINLAQVRCIPFDRLVERLHELPTDSLSSEIVYAIEECERTRDQNHSLAIALLELTRIVDDTKGINKERMDRRIGRLLQILPPDLSQPIALECISHKRKSRRTAGLKGLKLGSVDEITSRYLIDCFDRTNDLRILKALLQHPLILSSIESIHLFASFENDDYWQMRIVEATLRADKTVGSTFAQTHPASFVWAAGRIGDPNLLSEISNCFEVANNKLDLIGIVSWAYGKLGAHTELTEMRSTLEAFERKYGLPSE